MPLSRSRTRKLIGEEDVQSTTSDTSLKSEEISGRITKRKPITTRSFPPPIQGIVPHPTAEQLAAFAISDYNNKHGTDLELVRLCDKNIRFFGPGYIHRFIDGFCMWSHFNLEARRQDADPSDPALLLFAEVYGGVELHLSKLSLVNPSDQSYGCQSCCRLSDINIHHPPRGFSACYDSSVAPMKLKKLSKKDVIKHSNSALDAYNRKNGTHLKFLSALEGKSFISAGVLKDFDVKITRWIHMNFVAIVGHMNLGFELRLFGELYLGGNGEFELSTLSAAEPSDEFEGGIWKKYFIKEHECPGCPASIYHPWRGFHFGFNCPPEPGYYAPGH